MSSSLSKCQNVEQFCCRKMLPEKWSQCDDTMNGTFCNICICCISKSCKLFGWLSRWVWVHQSYHMDCQHFFPGHFRERATVITVNTEALVIIIILCDWVECYGFCQDKNNCLRYIIIIIVARSSFECVYSHAIGHKINPLQVLLLLFRLHISVDFDWDILALRSYVYRVIISSTPFFF